MDETILIQKSQQGDMDAFEQLLLRYEKKVYTIAYKYMGNAEDASDLAQESLIKAYQSIGSFRGEAAFGTWIGRITANKCLDELRKRKKLQTTSLDDELELEEGSVQKEIVSETDTPEQHTIRQETVHYVQQKLEQMRDEYRIVLVLRELEGYSYESIADMLNCSLGTVKSRISRARNHLKELVLADQQKERSRSGAGREL